MVPTFCHVVVYMVHLWYNMCTMVYHGNTMVILWYFSSRAWPWTNYFVIRMLTHELFSVARPNLLATMQFLFRELVRSSFRKSFDVQNFALCSRNTVRISQCALIAQNYS